MPQDLGFLCVAALRVAVIPSHAAAKALQGDTFEQLGFGSENGTWRSAYLAGATELRKGNFGTPTQTASPDMFAALSPEQVFDAIAIRIDGPKAWDEKLSIGVELTDAGESYRLDLHNGALVHRAAPVDGTQRRGPYRLRGTRPRGTTGVQ